MASSKWISRRWRLAITGLFPAIFAAAELHSAALCPVSNQKIAIPSYFYPGDFWTQLQQAAPTVGLAIINPDSGPGKIFDQNYADEVARAQASGVWVIGYVATGYGKRSKAKVKAEINKYYTMYHVDGIFLDEASSSCAKKSYYKDLYAYVKNKGGTAKVVINPGVAIQECFVEASDIIVNFEGDYSSYQNWQASGWEAKYPSDRFWHLIYNTDQTTMAAAVSLSKQRQAGWVYVTPDQLNNPWDTLPSEPYWSDELMRISQ